MCADGFAALREKIEDHLAKPADLENVLREGSARARAVAGETMADVRNAMKMPSL